MRRIGVAAVHAVSVNGDVSRPAVGRDRDLVGMRRQRNRRDAAVVARVEEGDGVAELVDDDQRLRRSGSRERERRGDEHDRRLHRSTSGRDSTLRQVICFVSRGRNPEFGPDPVCAGLIPRRWQRARICRTHENSSAFRRDSPRRRRAVRAGGGRWSGCRPAFPVLIVRRASGEDYRAAPGPFLDVAAETGLFGSRSLHTRRCVSRCGNHLARRHQPARKRVPVSKAEAALR